MRFSGYALGHVAEVVDDSFANSAPDRETLVAIAMGFAVPADDGSFRRPSPEAQARAQEILRADEEA